jgi:CRISPR type III-A-associated RAMP protein Csm5
MSKVKIETLMPVHVGSGNLLYNNSDFIGLNINKKLHIVVLSADKIWKLMGEKGVDFIDMWLQTIEKKGNIREFIAKFAPDAKSKDYAKRRIPLFVVKALKGDDTLKECIHNGMGLPYIPGSSIKGAIRTAVLASITDNISNQESLIRRENRGRVTISAKEVEKKAFGNDPNSDVFRFIQVGDAYFEEETEIATRLVNLNIRQSDDLMDSSKPQLVEAIGQEAESEFQLKISKSYYDFVQSRFRQIGKLPVNSVSDLFRLINEHTRKLVEDEIEIWDNIDKDGGEDYVSEMKNILEKINTCEDKKSCVLRLGHASGWRFITGAWTEKLSNFKDTVIPASRPKNQNYEKYDFPKTRRLDEESFVLGFVKLTIL